MPTLRNYSPPGKGALRNNSHSSVADTSQAAQIARSVPDFVLKGRCADLVKLDSQALEQEIGFAVGRMRPW